MSTRSTTRANSGESKEEEEARRVIRRQKRRDRYWRQKDPNDPTRLTIQAFENGNGGTVVDRAGLTRQRFPVPAATHGLLTERQRTVLKGRVRMSRGWVRMEKIMAETGMTMAEFVEGLTVEELVRGKFKNKNGHMQGRPPKWVPREFHQACLRELMRRGREMWEKNYLAAIEAMTEIATGKGQIGQIATPGERLKAAQFVVERMEGKVPERLIITDDQPWQTVMGGIVAEVSDEAIARGAVALEASRGAIVEGELVDVEYDDDDYEEEPDPVPARSRRRRK